MSTIAENITRIKNAKEDIIDAIVAKGGTVTQPESGTAKIDTLAACIRSIPSSGGANVAGVTAKPSDVSSNVKFVKADGTLVYGTMPTVTQPAPTISVNQSTGVITANYTPVAGRVADVTIKSSTLLLSSSVSAANIKANTTVLGVAGTFTADANAVADDILLGKTAYVNGVKITGTVNEAYQPRPTINLNTEYGVVIASYTPKKGIVGDAQIGLLSEELNLSAYIPAENIKANTTVLGVTGTFTSDATATASDIASGKSAYVNGVKVIGSASGGGSSTFSYPMNNTLVGSDMGEFVPCSGYSDWEMEGRTSWDGLFVTDTLLGSSRYVLSFPDQSATMEEWDGEIYPGWETRAYSCAIPIDPATVISKTSWSIEFCFCIGDMWNTSNQSSIFGAKKYNGGLICLSCGIENGRVALHVDYNTNIRSNVLTIDKNQWCYAKFIRINETVYLYLVPSPTQASIDSLTTDDAVCTLNGIGYGDIGSAYKNDVFFMGYEAVGDYRIFKMANIKITVG